MARNTNTPAASHARSSKASKASKAQQAQAPQAPLYTVGTMPPVRPGTHRAYAQQVAHQLAKRHKAGFTLLQYRQALVAGAAASSIAPPQGGWAKHNMPTWAAGQGWLVPAKAKAPSKAKAPAKAPAKAKAQAPAKAPAKAPSSGAQQASSGAQQAPAQQAPSGAQQAPSSGAKA